MAHKVSIPTQLRPLVGGASVVEAGGETVADVVADLEGRHPGIGERILDESGVLRRFVNLYVDGEDVRFLGGLDAPVPEQSEISIIPAVAGG